jgi:hypothetical protein
MVLTMALANLRVKASMHGGIAFYIVVNVFGFGVLPGTLALVFALAICWSRWEMKRHNCIELVLGSLVGFIFGGIGLIV